MKKQAQLTSSAASPDNLIAKAANLLSQGALCDAESICHQVLGHYPGFVDALHLLAIVRAQQSRHDEALCLFSRARALQPGNPELNKNHDITLSRYKKELLVTATSALAQRDWDTARACSRKMIDADPNDTSALHVFIEASLRSGDTTEARQRLDTSLDNRPDFELFHMRGRLQMSAGDHAGARTSFERVLSMHPGHLAALCNLGNALQALGCYEDAIVCYDKALEIAPDFVEVLFNRGLALQTAGCHEQALISYDAALARHPDFAPAHCNRGNVLLLLGRHTEAIAAYDLALASDPQQIEALANRAAALTAAQRLDPALQDLLSVQQQVPDYDFLMGDVMHLERMLCLWDGHAVKTDSLVKLVLEGKKIAQPFPALSLSENPRIHLQASQTYADATLANITPLPQPAPLGKGPRLRIGYFSTDFREHPVGHLIAPMLEHHDRSSFSVHAFAYGFVTDNPVRERVKSAVDGFHEVSHLGDADIARLARREALDIAVDLTGYTHGSRSSIFAYRPAAIQISYLGFPGTMATPCIDYLFANTHLIPSKHRDCYLEQILYLPDHYFARERIDPRNLTKPSRSVFGLPEQGCVFCCFNNAYKISPACFAVWLSLLEEIPESVLWLYDDNPTATRNLRQHAQNAGVDPQRLVFAPRRSTSDYLAQYLVADLFLDTFGYNANATAADALAMGLPVISLPGPSLISRTGASLLHAIDLPDLVVESVDTYKRLAFDLATNPDKLSKLRNTLAANCLHSPLFDVPNFVRHLESAYRACHRRHCQGLPPDDLRINP